MNDPTTKSLLNGTNTEKRRADESPSFVRAAHPSVYLTDVEIQPTSEKPLYRPTGWSKREKLMIAGLIVLLVLCILFIALFAKAVSKKSDRKSEDVEKESIGWILAASDILSAMNANADPCDDFYEYACGKWIEKSSIPESKSSWSQFYVVDQNNEIIMKRLILEDKDKTRAQYKDNEAVMKGFDMFDSCMDENKINELGADPLLNLIKEYGSWNVTDGNWTEDSWDFMENFVKIRKYLSVQLLFGMHVIADLKDSTEHIIYFNQGGISMSQESYLKNASRNIKARSAYKKLMIDLVKLLTDNPNVEALMTEIYDFEESLAKTFIPREQRPDLDEAYKKMKLSDFIKSTGNAFDMMDFVKRMFNQTGYNITGDELVVGQALDYFKNMSDIFNATSKRVLANYMMWKVVLHFSGDLDSRFRDVFEEFRKSIMGTTDDDPRWQECLNVAYAYLGMPFSLLYVDETFEGESKKSAEEMIHDIREVFLTNLENLDWMDVETKRKAKEKALAVRENIGYPDSLRNKTALALDFKGFDVKKDQYFKNIVRANEFYNLKRYANLGKPVDKDRWAMLPATVNAYYSATENKIVFPAGILQKPFYDHRFPKALNYAGIGVVVGHEITHGFDNSGRLFNKDGNLADWWSNKSIEAFKNKSKCLEDQYSNYTFHSLNLNGEQTLAENIADNAGIKQAFQAYQNWKRRRGRPEPYLPGMKDFTNEQIFFLGFAQIWCLKSRPSAVERLVTFSSHSPEKFRVIGSLSNFDEFAKAYKCPKGSQMNPEKKCSVW
ncbi:endothelin-converting enzyme homolog [Stylophora pistillata]|uniref:endothelin-converting enzyme homolog n=1 Tax=Stylophora pistillata TaxID=50429 RepID=UPI000C045C65|nr:endothelin-converting enzyme homolog [Stylophora pistillata]